MKSERRAALIFFTSVWAAVAVAGVAELAVRTIESASDTIIGQQYPLLEQVLRADLDLHEAQIALSAARYAGSADERRAHFFEYGLHVAQARARLAGVVAEARGHGHHVVGELGTTALEGQATWSASARALMQVLESEPAAGEPRAQWREIESEFGFLTRLVEQVLTAGVAPILVAGQADLAARAARSKLEIGVALVLGLAISAIVILLAIRIIRQHNESEDLENEYRDFDRRMNRAMQLIETEPQALELVRNSLDQALGSERRAELIMADSSRSKVKRLASSSHGEQWRGCQVATPQDCPTMRRNTRMVFPSNRSFEACPNFRHDEHEPCSATCVPVSVMGHTVGVLHSIGPENVLPDAHELRRLDAIALKAGDKLGLLRTFTSKDILANTDTLTGLYNRRALEAQVPEIMEQHKMFSVAYGDLDHFKKLNDVHGHDIGDKAIRLFAEALRTTLRPTDLFARWGGEEFLIVLPGSNMHDSVRVLERLRERLKEQVASSRLPLFTASFGVSDSSMANDFDAIVNRADEALLRAKRNGRDRVERDGHWERDDAFVDVELSETAPLVSAAEGD